MSLLRQPRLTNDFKFHYTAPSGHETAICAIAFPFRGGAKTVGEKSRKDDMYMATANDKAVPNGFGENNLPTGIQFVGPAWYEMTLIDLADKYQKATDWHKQRPVLK